MKRSGLTLIEILFSIMILTVAALTVLLLIPEAGQAQRDNRLKLVAAMHVQSLVESFTNHAYDFQTQQNRLWIGNNDGSSQYADANGADLIHNASSPHEDLFVAGTLRRHARTLGQAARYDLEQVMTSQGSGLYPLPLGIARRLESPGDEIAEIIDDGGYIYYLNPETVSRFDQQMRRENGAEAGQENPLRNLLVGVVGHPTQNLVPVDPIGEPLYELYPFPPRHKMGNTGFQLYIDQRAVNTGSTRAIPAGTLVGGVPLPRDFEVRTYESNTWTQWQSSAIESGLGHNRWIDWATAKHGRRPNLRDIMWETTTWEWGARLENFTFSDTDDFGALKPEAGRVVNRWRAGIEHYRRLCDWHWGRINHQVRPIGFKSDASLSTSSRKIGERTVERIVTEPVIDPGSGDIVIGQDGLPQFTSRTVTETKDVTIELNSAGEMVEIEGGSLSAAGGFRGWVAPPRGMGTSSIGGSDILEEDAATGLTQYETHVLRTMPTLERRVHYRSAALALWASVACFDSSGAIVDITDHRDGTRIYIDSDGDGKADVDLDGDGTPDRDGNANGSFDGGDFHPTGTVTGYQGTTMVKRFLPKEANPLVTPFDELCLVLFNSASSYDTVRLADVLTNMDGMSLDEFEDLQQDGGTGTWSEIVHPAQIYALSHVAHAALMVTGYRPPFTDRKNSGVAGKHERILPLRDDQTYVADGEEWRLPHKVQQPTYQLDHQLDHRTILDTDRDLGGQAASLYPGIQRNLLAIPQRFLALRWRANSGGSALDAADLAGNHLLFDQATGEVLLSDAYLAAHADAKSVIDGDDNGTLDDPHHRDLFTNSSGAHGGDGIPDDLDDDGEPDLYIYITDPLENVVVLHNPYHRLAFPGQDGKNGNRELRAFPGLDPDARDTDAGQKLYDVDDATDLDSDQPDNENTLLDLYAGDWTGGLGPVTGWDAAHWQAGVPGRRWPLAVNGDDEDDDFAINDSIENQPYLQWTRDFDQDGLAEGESDEGPIPFRPLDGPILNEFPPPYAGTGGIDSAGHRRYHVTLHLRNLGGDTDPEFGLARIYAETLVNPATGMDLTYAHHAHENALRLAIAYTSRNPYDLTVPRPLNNQHFMSRPLAAFDLFDASGQAIRPDDVDAGILAAWYPLTMPPTAPIRFGNPSGRTEFVSIPTDWSPVYSDSRDDPRNPGDYPYGVHNERRDGKNNRWSSMNADYRDLPVLGQRFGPGKPFVFGSPMIHPDEPVDSGTNYRMQRDVDGDGSAPDIRTERVHEDWHIWTHTNGRPSPARQGGEAYPGWSHYFLPRRYNEWANKLHGHDSSNERRAWQTRTARPERFLATKATQANERARQIVYWSANWHAYEDAETAPGAPIDISRIPALAGSSTRTIEPGTWSNSHRERKWYITLDPFPVGLTRNEAVEFRKDGHTIRGKVDEGNPVRPPELTIWLLGATKEDGTDLDNEAAGDLLVSLLGGGDVELSFPSNGASYAVRDRRLPSGHPEADLAWVDPERTATRLTWDDRATEYLSVMQGTQLPLASGHGALPLAPTDTMTSKSTRSIRARDLDFIATPHLVPFGADRNGNGSLDVGATRKSVRLNAQIIARFTFYDPVMWMSPGR